MMSQETNSVLELADKVWDEYGFPDDVVVADIDGWEYSAPLSGDGPIRQTQAQPDLRRQKPQSIIDEDGGGALCDLDFGNHSRPGHSGQRLLSAA